MKQFLYRIQPTRVAMLTVGPTERESKVIAEHFEYLQGHVAKDIVLMAGRTLTADDRTFGIVVFVSASEAEAAQFMQNDPAVKQGIMKAELFPYQVALWSPKGPARETSDA
jgi:uncharacterized protein YciI